MCGLLQNISRGDLEPLKLSPDIDTYILHSQQGKYIVKCFKSSEAIIRMSRTTKLLTAIKSARLDFPCIIPEIVCETVAESVYLEEYLDGIPMGKAKFSEAEMTAVCSWIVGYMRDLRELGCCGYAPDGFSWRGFLSGFAERRIAAVMELGLWEAHVFREFFAYIRESVSILSEPERLCIVHNDLNPDGNILVDVSKGLKVHVIDYEKWILGDCVKDISKMIWYFRRHKKFGDCFIDMYSEAVCVPDMRTVKLYFALDILNHFSEYRKLITQEGWDVYFQQELEIMQEIWKDDFNLW